MAAIFITWLAPREMLWNLKICPRSKQKKKVVHHSPTASFSWQPH